jgi:hypothetical protein
MIKTYTKNDILANKYTNVSDINNILEPYIKYYVDENDQKINNKNYDEPAADNFLLELKKQASHVEKIDTAHENYHYYYARSNADDGYLSLGEQLDLQYWDSVNGTTEWKNHVQQVKERYPKN